MLLYPPQKIHLLLLDSLGLFMLPLQGISLYLKCFFPLQNHDHFSPQNDQSVVLIFLGLFQLSPTKSIKRGGVLFLIKRQASMFSYSSLLDSIEQKIFLGSTDRWIMFLKHFRNQRFHRANV